MRHKYRNKDRVRAPERCHFVTGNPGYAITTSPMVHVRIWAFLLRNVQPGPDRMRADGGGCNAIVLFRRTA